MIYIVGHRGAAGVRPENTIEGFNYAIDLGVDYVECDIHLTSDNQLIVMHDLAVDRTTDGSGKIADLSFETIRSLDAGSGQQVPTLEEVLRTTRGKVHLLCELKGEGTEMAAIEAVCAHQMEQEVTFTSFHVERIQKVKRTDANLRIGAVFANPSEDDIKFAKDIGAGGIGTQFRNICFRIIEQAHKVELDIRAWNPDTLDDQLAMIGLGVDGVSTNRPDVLMEHIKKG